MAKYLPNTFLLYIYLLGFSLWAPNISLLTIGDAWGLQIAAIVNLLMTIHLLITLIYKFKKIYKINVFQEWLFVHLAFIISICICTLFSSVGIDRSIKTFGVEVLGAIFSITTSWWFCRDIKYLHTFINGFKLGGVISAIYGIYQLFGLRFDWYFAYIPVSNASFSTVSLIYSQDILRAFGLTPEPSILASLLWVMLGIATSDVLIFGGFNNYLILAIVILGLIATSSQSISLLPLYIFFIIILNRYLNLSKRNFNTYDLLGILVLIVSCLFILLTNESIIYWLSRLVDQDNNQSAIMRFNDVIIGIEMFIHSPFTGWGLGSVSEVMGQFTNQLGISMSSDGITSGFFRVVAEQGLTGLFSMLLSLVYIIPPKLIRHKSKDSLAIFMYQISFIISALVSLALFVGYRNLYHLWLIIPMGLSIKSQFKRLLSTEQQSKLEMIHNN